MSSTATDLVRLFLEYKMPAGAQWDGWWWVKGRVIHVDQGKYDDHEHAIHMNPKVFGVPRAYIRELNRAYHNGDTDEALRLEDKILAIAMESNPIRIGAIHGNMGWIIYIDIPFNHRRWYYTAQGLLIDL